MSTHVIRARAPIGRRRTLPITTDPDLLAPRLTDAAHFTGGVAAGLVLPESEADVAEVLACSPAVLPIGAQSSLTGGATPFGDLVLSTERMNGLVKVSGGIQAGAGVSLAALDAALMDADCYYPPAPTFDGAFIGGTVATNAGGAATFKYGTTRAWLEAMTIVLATGDVLDIVRGETRAHPDGYFDLELQGGTVRVPLPDYQMPSVPKLSAGYYAAPRMDLIDLFIGCEGTLGVVTEVTLRVLSPRPAWCLAFVPFSSKARGLAFVRKLREASIVTRTTHDRSGVEASAIEHMDARSLALLRDDGIDRANGVNVPADTELALLVTLELPAGMTQAAAFDELSRADAGDAPDTPLVRFYRLLADAGATDAVEIAVPGDRHRMQQLLAVREGVPAAVNSRVARAKANVDGRIEKTAADMIVPMDRFEELLDAYDQGFRRRGLDAAVWGHVSDGNVHPNVIPKTYADVESGREAILEFGRLVQQLGGAPLAEHGVGRSRIKQQLLEQLYGAGGIDQMRRTKRALDPDWRLAPGVLFPKFRKG